MFQWRITKATRHISISHSEVLDVFTTVGKLRDTLRYFVFLDQSPDSQFVYP